MMLFDARLDLLRPVRCLLISALAFLWSDHSRVLVLFRRMSRDKLRVVVAWASTSVRVWLSLLFAATTSAQSRYRSSRRTR